MPLVGCPVAAAELGPFRRRPCCRSAAATRTTTETDVAGAWCIGLAARAQETISCAAVRSCLPPPLRSLRPRIARAQGNRVLRFIPQADVTVLDPIWTTAYVTRNHGYMIFDTLFGTDGAFKASPQMAAGMIIDDDGKLVRIDLRDGLKFHDGTPVLARDCVASIQRWAKRDTFGQTLMAVTDELTRDRRQDHCSSA